VAVALAGEPILAADVEELYDGWDTYTPTWTASTNPAIGNGAIAGRYKRQGSVVHFWISLLMGSTTTYGSGQWSIGLPPVTPVDPASPFGDYTDIGRFSAIDTSAVLRYHGPTIRNTGSNVIMLTSASGAAVATMSSTVPFTWANTDRLTLKGSYECAGP